MIWRPLNNLVNSLKTYHLLSPDPKARQDVNDWLARRPNLTCQEWFLTHWTPPAVAQALPQPLIEFVYDRLQHYSGLQVGSINPQDRLVKDLRFPGVCWFDWGINLCEDFQKAFGIDISDSFDESRLKTCADLVFFLEQQLESFHKTRP
jgi:hypothetical protein